jgi:hypothetical protein
LSTPLVPDDERAEADRGIDPDFIGWLHNDPMVTRNPASRYCDRTHPATLLEMVSAAWRLVQPTTEVRLFLLPSG